MNAIGALKNRFPILMDTRIKYKSVVTDVYVYSIFHNLVNAIDLPLPPDEVNPEEFAEQ